MGGWGVGVVAGLGEFPMVHAHLGGLALGTSEYVGVLFFLKKNEGEHSWTVIFAMARQTAARAREEPKTPRPKTVLFLARVARASAKMRSVLT